MMRLDDARGLGDASRRFAAVCVRRPAGDDRAVRARDRQRPQARDPQAAHVRADDGPDDPCTRASVPDLPRAARGPATAARRRRSSSIPPAIVAALLVVVAIVYDWRTVGRPHKAYIYGGLAVLGANVLDVIMAGTEHVDGASPGYLQSLGG